MNWFNNWWWWLHSFIIITSNIRATATLRVPRFATREIDRTSGPLCMTFAWPRDRSSAVAFAVGRALGWTCAVKCIMENKLQIRFRLVFVTVRMIFPPGKSSPSFLENHQNLLNAFVNNNSTRSDFLSKVLHSDAQWIKTARGIGHDSNGPRVAK